LDFDKFRGGFSGFGDFGNREEKKEKTEGRGWVFD
jgi:hypothetical protein